MFQSLFVFNLLIYANIIIYNVRDENKITIPNMKFVSKTQYRKYNFISLSISNHNSERINMHLYTGIDMPTLI